MTPGAEAHRLSCDASSVMESRATDLVSFGRASEDEKVMVPPPAVDAEESKERRASRMIKRWGCKEGMQGETVCFMQNQESDQLISRSAMITNPTASPRSGDGRMRRGCIASILIATFEAIVDQRYRASYQHPGRVQIAGD